MKPILLTFCILLASLFPEIHLGAQEGEKEEPTPEAMEAAGALLKEMGMEETVNNMYERAFGMSGGNLQALGLPEEVLTQVSKEMITFFTEAMPWSSVEPDLREIYASYFTAEELREMTAFYKTPTGKKAARLVPALSAESMNYTRERMNEKMPELRERIGKIVNKWAEENEGKEAPAE